MAINLYSGSLRNYYSRNFVTPIEKVARDTGMTYRLVSDIDYLSLSETPKKVGRFVEKINARLDGTATWDELEKDYFCSQIPEESYLALKAHTRRHYLELPQHSTVDDLSRTPELNGKDYIDSFEAHLEMHMFVPSRLRGFILEKNPLGLRCAISTHAELRIGLNHIIDNVFDPSSRGGLHDGLSRRLLSTIVTFAGKPKPEDRIRATVSEDYPDRTAEYALGIYCEALAFGEARNLPVILDT